jgi:RNA polymerase sigma-70 factor, ECF subfamily
MPTQDVRGFRNDDALLGALRAGDEAAFNHLVDEWSGAMLRVAHSHVNNRAIAEEVVQDAWLTLIRSLDRFEGRSSLRTWVLGIVINVARARARTERRSLHAPSDVDGRAVDPSRFLPEDHPRWPRHWATEPIKWRTPEQELLADETRAVIFEAIAALPETQRAVLVLRDVEGLTAAEVCNIASITDTNQRVLLHRARSRVRTAIEQYFAASENR